MPTHPTLDTKLRYDGFARLDEPLLGADEAAALRQRFFQIYPGRNEGWHNAFNVTDLAYRQESRSILDSALSQRLSQVLDGFAPFLYTYLVKWPGNDLDDNFLYLHRDWMYVDESLGGRCFVAFVALDDIDEMNGRVSVLPQGHAMDTMLRGTNMAAPWLSHDSLIASHMEALSLDAGHAMLWDSSIVHSSASNRSAKPRVAVGIWMKPADSTLVHYRRINEEVAELHEVEPDFFYSQTPESIEGFLNGRVPKAETRINDPMYDRAEVEFLLQQLRSKRVDGLRA